MQDIYENQNETKLIKKINDNIIQVRQETSNGYIEYLTLIKDYNATT